MSEPSQQLGPADVEAIVRTYLARMGRRYAPLIAVFLVLILIAVLMPSRSQNASDLTGGSEQTQGFSDTQSGSGTSTSGTGSSTPGSGASSGSVGGGSIGTGGSGST